MDTTTAQRPECEAFIAYLTHERNDSEHTVKAYQRDLNTFQDFCDDYFGGAGAWTWESVDRLTIRSFMGELTRGGLTKRSVSRVRYTMNANFGLLPPLPNRVRDKRKKRESLATRALEAMAEFAARLSGVPT